MLTNEYRKLLGLEEITEGDEVIDLSVPSVEKSKAYIRNNQVIKLVQIRDHLYKEIDYEIDLDDEKKLISRKGSKPKTLTLKNIRSCKTKKMRLTVDKRYGKYELKIGIAHFPVMYFEQSTPTIEELQKQLIELYGDLSEWEQQKTNQIKKTKSRYLPKEGDIFSYPVCGNKYGFAIIIGSFTRFRKNKQMPTDTKHYLNLMMGVPLIIRSFDFLSDQNQVDPSMLRNSKLLNPEIIMDDNVLRGTYPVIGNIALRVEDIVLPMSFSFNGPHTTYAGYHAYTGTYWETLNRLQEEIAIRFDWGFGSKTMRATEFLKKSFIKEPVFKPLSGLGLSPCSENKEELISPATIFSEKELSYIFDLLDIESELDFDQFNEKYGGITRTEYLNQLEIQRKS